jgi:hypothetical protein
VIAVTTAVPAAVPVSGLPLALTIACAVTALAAICTVVVQLRRTSRLTIFTGGLGVASAAGILAIAAVVAVSLSGATPPVPTVSSLVHSTVSNAVDHSSSDGVQLPTLALDD